MTQAALAQDRPFLSFSSDSPSPRPPSNPPSNRNSATPSTRRQSFAPPDHELNARASRLDSDYPASGDNQGQSAAAETDYHHGHPLASLDGARTADAFAVAEAEDNIPDAVHPTSPSSSHPVAVGYSSPNLASVSMPQTGDVGDDVNPAPTFEDPRRESVTMTPARSDSLAAPIDTSFLAMTPTPEPFEGVSPSYTHNSREGRSRSSSISSIGRPTYHNPEPGAGHETDEAPDTDTPLNSRTENRRVSSSMSPIKAGRRAGLVLPVGGRSRTGSESRTRATAHKETPEKEKRLANQIGAAANGGAQAWHPLSSVQDTALREANNDSSTSLGPPVVVDDGAIVDSRGHVLIAEDDEERDAERDDDALQSPRRTHPPLHLELKPPSPQPWDLVDPPSSNGHPKTDTFSAPSTHRFQTLQSQRRQKLIPQSSYYFGPPPPDSAYGTAPMGQIGHHHPREILRIERDYTGGELIQFAPIYPLELEGRITPTQFLESINAINELLISAHSLRHSFFDNALAVLTLQLSRILVTTHYEKKMLHLRHLFDELNSAIYNPVGLNLLWPRKVAFLFLEIEYY
ncbi:hypothetical protein HGRIS_014725 [Hohenbuehelia grisea]|uniref:Ras modification protein ERF4 n=1 Tax=Hohenbuehelia grisea TaxID=104357 RepID=A0ABR3IQJ2_9AGAR